MMIFREKLTKEDGAIFGCGLVGAILMFAIMFLLLTTVII